MKFLTVQQYEGIKAALMVGTQDGTEIARQFGVSDSVVYKTHNLIKKGKFEEILTKAARFHGHAKSNGKQKSTKRLRHTETEREADKLEARILALREKGFTYKEIGKKVGLTPASVGYYAVTRAQNKNKQLSPRGLDSFGKEQTNGNNPANRNILIGIAYAETERFISNLSERIAIPAEILRRRLAELLGHSPLR